jgi:hypothetical protein
MRSGNIYFPVTGLVGRWRNLCVVHRRKSQGNRGLCLKFGLLQHCVH